jgi:hypothetical protein
LDSEVAESVRQSFPKKVGEKDALSRVMPLLNEPDSRLRRTIKVPYTPTIGIPARFVKLAGRSWIHVLGGGAPRLYTRSTSESDSKAQESGRERERVRSTKVR